MDLRTLIEMPPLRQALLVASVEDIARAFELEPKTIEGYAKRLDWRPSLDQIRVLNPWVLKAIEKVKKDALEAAAERDRQEIERRANEAVRAVGEAHFACFADATLEIGQSIYKATGKWVDARLTLEGNNVRYVAHLAHQPIPNGHGTEHLWNVNVGVMVRRAFEAIAQALGHDITTLLYLLPERDAEDLRLMMSEVHLSGHLRATMGDDPWAAPPLNADSPDAPLRRIFSQDEGNDTPLRVVWEGSTHLAGIGPVRLVLAMEQDSEGVRKERLYFIPDEILLRSPGLAVGWRACAGKTVRFIKPRHGDVIPMERAAAAQW